MSNIKRRPLADCLIKIIDYRGKTPKKLGSDWSESGFRAISANNVKFDGLTNLGSIKYVDAKTYKKWMKEEVKTGDLLLTSEAPAGQVMLWMSDEKIVLSQRLFGLRTKENVDNKFLKYYLQSSVGQKEILKNTSGSTVFGISAKMFDLIQVFLPDYDSQVLIGNVLHNIDAKIELNNRINAELGSLAKALYDYWFVQFDFPDPTGNPYKTSGGKIVYNEDLKREIPDDWKVYKLEDILRCNYKSITKSSEYESVNYLDTSNLTDNVIDTIQNINLEYEELPSRAQRIVEKTDILYSTVRPNQRHFGIIKHPLENLIASTGFAQLTSKIEAIKNELIYLYLTSESTINRLQKIADSSVSSYPSISPNDLLALKIALPKDEKILIKISSMLVPVFDKQSIIQKQNKQLAELRDWLLPMLMNGQVKVKDASSEE